MAKATVDRQGKMMAPLAESLLTLEQRLALFKPAVHAGEFMKATMLGNEVCERLNQIVQIK